MTLKQDLETEVGKIFREQWTTRDGREIPVPENLRLGNDAVRFEEATVLYADMAASTQLVNSERPMFAAEVYKTYLGCAARIIKDEGGTITAYDGDRVMAVFIGDAKNSSAARAALKVNGAVFNIINPALERQYPNKSYRVAHHIGIDTSPLFAARIGVRNDNDLVWVGRAANYAAKLCAITEENKTFITEEVYARLRDDAKFYGSPPQLMWVERRWTPMNNKRIYHSSWWLMP